MKNELYRNRLADQTLSEYLRSFGAVCVEGPKWCGKTWLAQHQAVSACMIADPTDNFATRGRVALDLNYAFAGDKPHLIDEWQEFPALWDATRYHVWIAVYLWNCCSISPQFWKSNPICR